MNKIFVEIDRISKLYFTGVEQQHFIMDVYESLNSLENDEISSIQPESEADFRPFIIHHLGKDKYEIIPLETDKEITKRVLWDYWRERNYECAMNPEVIGNGIFNDTWQDIKDWLDKENK